MNGKKLLERGLRLGIPLWRIEDELDWQENQGRRSAENMGEEGKFGILSDAKFGAPSMAELVL